MCPWAWRQGVYIYSAVVMSFLTVEYLIFALLFFRFRKSFHTMFSTSLLILILTNATYNFGIFARNFSHAIDETSLWDFLGDVIVAEAYAYMQAIELIILVERLFALIYAENYENKCYWPIYLVAQLIAAVLVFVQVFLCDMDPLCIDDSGYFRIGFSLFITIGIVIMYFANHYCKRKSRTTASLSTKYQFLENAATLRFVMEGFVQSERLMLPYMALNTLLWLLFSVSNYFFDAAHFFDVELCTQRVYYLPLYLFIRTVNFLILAIIPILAAKQNELMWKAVNGLIGRKVKETKFCTVNIPEQKMDVYFVELQRVWHSTGPRN
ncbi:unnamed protein product [Caenorhabditis auriculariae]|uniref:Uncharacterized protein n=1 Tax=Caenorhabditis auriculariae TaxID=2777116 RepID=A0A8S1HUU8_9PELO|nr:unnamed protein product [Caenorhabditis auriculariae]